MDTSTNIESHRPDHREMVPAERAMNRPPQARDGSSALPVCDGVEIFKKTPCVTGLQRAGRDVAQDILEIASIPLLNNTSLDHGHLYGDCLIVMGPTGMEKSKTVTWKSHQNVVGFAGKLITIIGVAVGSGGNPVSPDSLTASRNTAGRLMVAEEIFNAKLTDKEWSAYPSKSIGRVTNHASGTMWNYARQAGAANGAAARPGRAHEKRCYADV